MRDSLRNPSLYLAPLERDSQRQKEVDQSSSSSGNENTGGAAKANPEVYALPPLDLKVVDLDGLIAKWAELWVRSCSEQKPEVDWYSITGEHKVGESFDAIRDDESFKKRSVQSDYPDLVWPPRMQMRCLDAVQSIDITSQLKDADSEVVAHFGSGLFPRSSIGAIDGDACTLSVPSSIIMADHVFNSSVGFGVDIVWKVDGGRETHQRYMFGKEQKDVCGEYREFHWKKFKDQNAKRRRRNLLRKNYLKKNQNHLSCEVVKKTCQIRKRILLSGHVVVAGRTKIHAGKHTRRGGVHKKWVISIDKVFRDLKEYQLKNQLPVSLLSSLSVFTLKNDQVFFDVSLGCEVVCGHKTESYDTKTWLGKLNRQIQRFEAALARHNRHNLMISRLFYEDVPLGKYYARLTLLQGNQFNALQNRLKQVDGHDRDETLAVYNHLIGGSEDAFDHKILLPKAQSLHTRTLVTGTAGVGKTTLCKKLASQVNGWCFYIPIRNLTEDRYPVREDKAYTLVEVLVKEGYPHYLQQRIELFNQTPIYYDLLEMIVQGVHKSLSSAVIILDGYDERNIPLHLDSVFKQLMSCQHVIITSRPYNLVGLSDRYDFVLDKWVEVTGFDIETMKKYVVDFFNSLDLFFYEVDYATKLFQHLEKTPYIEGACKIPVNCELACTAWGMGVFNERTVTMSGLYQSLWVSLCRRYVKKYIPLTKLFENIDWPEISEHCYLLTAFAEYFAFSGLVRGQLFMDTSEARKYLPENEQSIDFLLKQERFGFIKRILANALQVENQFYFNHLTFRDYFAARYIATALQVASGSSSSERRVANGERISEYFNGFYFAGGQGHQWQVTTVEAFIVEHKFDASFEYVLWFVAGLLSESGDKRSLQYFYQCLLQAPHDALGLYTAILLVRCLEESQGILDQFDKDTKEMVFAVIHQWLTYSFQSQKVGPLLERLKLGKDLLKRPEMQGYFNNQLKISDFESLKVVSSFIQLSGIWSFDLIATLIQSLAKIEEDTNDFFEKMVGYMAHFLIQQVDGLSFLSRIESCEGVVKAIRVEMIKYSLSSLKFPDIDQQVLSEKSVQQINHLFARHYDSFPVKTALLRIKKLSVLPDVELQVELIKVWSLLVRLPDALQKDFAERSGEAIKALIMHYYQLTWVEYALSGLQKLGDMRVEEIQTALIKVQAWLVRLPFNLQMPVSGQSVTVFKDLFVWYYQLPWVHSIMSKWRTSSNIQMNHIIIKKVETLASILVLPKTLATALSNRSLDEVHSFFQFYYRLNWVQSALETLQGLRENRVMEIQIALIHGWAAVIALPDIINKILSKYWLQERSFPQNIYHGLLGVRMALDELRHLMAITVVDVQVATIRAVLSIVRLPKFFNYSFFLRPMNEMTAYLTGYYQLSGMHEVLQILGHFRKVDIAEVQIELVNVWRSLVVLPDTMSDALFQKSPEEIEKRLSVYHRSYGATLALQALKKLRDVRAVKVQLALVNVWILLAKLPDALKRELTSSAAIESMLAMYHRLPSTQVVLGELQYLSRNSNTEIQIHIVKFWLSIVNFSDALWNEKQASEKRVSLWSVYCQSSGVALALQEMVYFSKTQEEEVQIEMVKAWASIVTFPHLLQGSMAKRSIKKIGPLFSLYYQSRALEASWRGLKYLSEVAVVKVQIEVVKVWASVIALPNIMANFFSKQPVDKLSRLLRHHYQSKGVDFALHGLQRFGTHCKAAVQVEVVKAWESVVTLPNALKKMLFVAKGSQEKIASILSLHDIMSSGDISFQALESLSQVAVDEVQISVVRAWRSVIRLPEALNKILYLPGKSLNETESLLSMYYRSPIVASALHGLQRLAGTQFDSVQVELANAWASMVIAPNALRQVLRSSDGRGEEIERLLSSYYCFAEVFSALKGLESLSKLESSDVQVAVVKAWSHVIDSFNVIGVVLSKQSVKKLPMFLLCYHQLPYINSILARLEHLGQASDAKVQCEVIKVWSMLAVFPDHLKQILSHQSLQNMQCILDGYYQSSLLRTALQALQQLSDDPAAAVQAELVNIWSPMVNLFYDFSLKMGEDKDELKHFLQAYYDLFAVEVALSELKKLSAMKGNSAVCIRVAKIWSLVVRLPSFLRDEIMSQSVEDVKSSLSMYYLLPHVKAAFQALGQLGEVQDNALQIVLIRIWSFVARLPDLLLWFLSQRSSEEAEVFLNWYYVLPGMQLSLTHLQMIGKTQEDTIKVALVKAWFEVLTFPDALSMVLSERPKKEAMRLISKYYQSCAEKMALTELVQCSSGISSNCQAEVDKLFQLWLQKIDSLIPINQLPSIVLSAIENFMANLIDACQFEINQSIENEVVDDQLVLTSLHSLMEKYPRFYQTPIGDTIHNRIHSVCLALLEKSSATKHGNVQLIVSIFLLTYFSEKTMSYDDLQRFSDGLAFGSEQMSDLVDLQVQAEYIDFHSVLQKLDTCPINKVLSFDFLSIWFGHAPIDALLRGVMTLSQSSLRISVFILIVKKLSSEGTALYLRDRKCFFFEGKRYESVELPKGISEKAILSDIRSALMTLGIRPYWLERELQVSLASSPRSFFAASSVQKEDHVYGPERINALLEALLVEDQKASAVWRLDAAAAFRHNATVAIDFNAIKAEALQRLKGSTLLHVLMPLDFGGGYWGGLHMMLRESMEDIDITYVYFRESKYDASLLEDVIYDAFGQDADVVKRRGDREDSGPWVVASLRALLAGKNVPKTLDVKALRAAQLASLAQLNELPAASKGLRGAGKP